MIGCGLPEGECPGRCAVNMRGPAKRQHSLMERSIRLCLFYSVSFKGSYGIWIVCPTFNF